ncbi:MAG TPA: thermonuclease family protein [Hyphomicrobium sp.]
MLGWRKRKDGFEWREYVRTTILVRRKNRRAAIARAGHVAVDGLKVAGERGAAAGAVGAQAFGRAAKAAGQQGMVMGAAGAQIIGRGAKAAGQQGFAMGAAGLRAADDRIRAGLPIAWAGLQTFGRKIWSTLVALWAFTSAAALRLAEVSAPVMGAGWRRLEPALSKLRKPGISAVLALIAGVAFVGSFRRVAENGFGADIFIALLVGSVIACALLAAWLAEGVPSWLGAILRPIGGGMGRLADALRGLAPSGASLARGGAVVAAVVVVAAGWLVWRAAIALPSLLTNSDSALQGRAVALSGDTLRIGGTTLALSGIEAPVDGQTCTSDDDARPWRCDSAARTALARLLRSRSVTCELFGSEDIGRKRGTCRQGEKDIAAELVRGGHVFAKAGIFSSYGALESEAQGEKIGIWRGKAERPSDYRAQKWEEATREAPEGCPIKGRVTGGRRVYVLPWSEGYERVKVSSRKGERWFCSEDEALTAGWKPSESS